MDQFQNKVKKDPALLQGLLNRQINTIHFLDDFNQIISKHYSGSENRKKK